MGKVGKLVVVVVVVVCLTLNRQHNITTSPFRGNV